jgi:hypothetical protein
MVTTLAEVVATHTKTKIQMSLLFEKGEEDWPQRPIPSVKCGQSEVCQSKGPRKTKFPPTLLGVVGVVSRPMRSKSYDPSVLS